jgi:hypothetical protein
MEMVFYAYVATLILLLALIVKYQVGASSLRQEIKLKARDFEAVVFPPAAQPTLLVYSAIPLRILFRAESVSPPLPPAVLRKLRSLGQTALGATAVALASFVTLAFLLIGTPGASI